MEDMLNYCGFNSAFDMIKSHLTEDELMDLLSDLLHENKDIAQEICEEIAFDLYEWVDIDKLFKCKVACIHIGTNSTRIKKAYIAVTSTFHEVC